EQRGWERTLEEGRLGRGGGPGFLSRIYYPGTVVWQTRIALCRADHIFCLNEEDRSYLESRFGLAANIITRIFPGAHPVYGNSAEARDYSRTRTLLFAGTWMKRKGTEDVIRAFSVLSERHPHLRLVVLNGGVPENAVLDAFPEEVRNRVSCRQASPETGTAE